MNNFISRFETLEEAAQRIYEGKVRSMETFDHYHGIERAIIGAIPHACATGIGWRYRGCRSPGGFSVHVAPHRYDDRKITLTAQWYAKYGGVFDYFVDAGRFNDAFTAIRASIEEQVTAKYPDAQISLMHNGIRKREIDLILNVNITPRFP